MTRRNVLLIGIVVALIAYSYIAYQFLFADKTPAATPVDTGSVTALTGDFSGAAIQGPTINPTTTIPGQATTGDDLAQANAAPATALSTAPVTILAPAGFVTSGAVALLTDGLSGVSIAVTGGSLSTYQTQLNSLWLKDSNVDIALVPSDRLANYVTPAYHIQFSDNSIVTSLFPQYLASYISADTSTYIPYILDPMVTRVRGNLVIPTGEFSLAKLLQLALLRAVDAPSTVPLLRGLTAADGKILSENKEYLPDQFMTLYSLIGDRATRQDSSTLSSYLDNQSSYSYRSKTKINSLVQRFTTINPQCPDQTVLCLLAYGGADMGFGFASDRVTRAADFSKAPAQASDFAMYPFPTTAFHPVKAWGFLVRRDSPRLAAALKVINAYLTLGSHGESALWPQQLSPFTTILSKQLIQPSNQYIAGLLTSPNFLYGGIYRQQNFFQNVSILPVLQKTYNTDMFVQGIKRTF